MPSLRAADVDEEMRVTSVLLLATGAAANYDDPRKGGCPANNSECWLPFSLFQSILFFH